MNHCPTADQLRRWLRHPESDGALADHVDGCPRCQQALEVLMSDPDLPPTRPETTVETSALERLREGTAARPTTADERRAPPAPAALGAVHPRPYSSGELPRLQEEIRALLQRRLRVFSLVIAGVFLTLE